MSHPSVVRVAMAKRVASSWLEKNAKSEYRITIYPGGSVKNLPTLLRSFRDGKIRIASIPIAPDLGLKVEEEKMSVWSSNREAMLALDKWLTDRSYETTGVW